MKNYRMNRIEKKEQQKIQMGRFLLSDRILSGSNSLSLIDLVENQPRENSSTSESNSRCVPVDTILISPDGRNAKRKARAKKALVKFRCSSYQKKLLIVKAKRSGLTLSEYCRRVALEKEVRERPSEIHMEVYKTLVKYHNSFKSIGNMFRKKDPRLSNTVYNLADELKVHLQNLRQ